MERAAKAPGYSRSRIARFIEQFGYKSAGNFVKVTVI